MKGKRKTGAVSGWRHGPALGQKIEQKRPVKNAGRFFFVSLQSEEISGIIYIE